MNLIPLIRWITQKGLLTRFYNNFNHIETIENIEKELIEKVFDIKANIINNPITNNPLVVYDNTTIT